MDLTNKLHGIKKRCPMMTTVQKRNNLIHERASRIHLHGTVKTNEREGWDMNIHVPTCVLVGHCGISRNRIGRFFSLLWTKKISRTKNNGNTGVAVSICFDCFPFYFPQFCFFLRSPVGHSRAVGVCTFDCGVIFWKPGIHFIRQGQPAGHARTGGPGNLMGMGLFFARCFSFIARLNILISEAFLH